MVKTPTTYDSRLLLNLVKAEKEVQDAFKGYTNQCEVANNALNGWAAADTGDSPDVLTVSNKVCELFDEAFDAQKTYLISLGNYRASLKDVAAREAEIRIILRDREIFVSRLVKLNSKKTPTSDSAFEAHSAKLEEARAELAACESTLKSEERALVGVKRRIFREALRMRMRAMAQLADVWRDSADRAMHVLDSLDPDNSSMTDLRLPAHQQPQPPPPTQVPPTPSSVNRHSRAFSSLTSPEGSVIAPSHSASQVARRAAGFPDDYSDDGMQGTTLGMSKGASNLGAPIKEEEEERGGSSDEEGQRGRQQQFQVHVNKPLTPKQIAEQKARERAAKEMAEQQQQRQQQQQQQQASQQVSSPRDAVSPVPTQQAQPRAAAPATLTNAANADSGLTNGAATRKRLSSAPAPATQADPNNPAAVAAQRLRETQEERQRRFASLGSTDAPAVVPDIPLPSASGFTIEAHRKRNDPGANMFLPSSDARTTSYRAVPDSDDEGQDEVADLQPGRRRTVSNPAGGARENRKSRALDDVTSNPSTARGGSRKLQSSRAPSSGGGGTRNSAAYYERSDAGTSVADEGTERGGSKKGGHKKTKSEDSRGSGFFGAVSGLFKKRDLSASKRYGSDDEETPTTSPRSKKSSGSGWGTRTDNHLSKSKKKTNHDDSDSDAPDPKSLVKVYNTPGQNRLTSSSSQRSRPASMIMTYSDIEVPRIPQRRATKVDTSNVWVPPPQREARRAMSDVGAPRSAPATAMKRKNSVKSNHTTVSQAPTVGTTGTVKKKKAAGAGARPVSTLTANAGAYDPYAFVQIVASSNKDSVGTIINPNQANRKDAPSMMSVVAPPAQSSMVNGMPLPSAKNPSRGITSSATTPNLGSLPSPTLPAEAAPLKKKKTVKKTTTNGASTPTLTSSATVPNLAPSTTPGMTYTSNGRPASILSAGSATTGLTERRKSVRLASDTRADATYENSGGPANIPRPTSPAMNGSRPQSILKESSGFGGEWNTRIAAPVDYSSDEEGDEYAKIRHQLSRSEKDWQSAGYLYKGKGRAV